MWAEDPDKELANLFQQHKLVDFIGTDSHRLDYKSPEVNVGATALRNTKASCDKKVPDIFLNEFSLI